MKKTRIAVIGAGVIGRTHMDTILRAEDFILTGIVEPGAAGPTVAKETGCRIYRDLDALIGDAPDGAIIATPNALHMPIGEQLLQAGIPVLIEKPIAEDVTTAKMLVDVAKTSGTAGLVGHHRRFNPIIQAAKAAITAGDFGDLVMATVTCSLFKPDSYFDISWRGEPENGGPLLINLIHEVDLLRHLFGPISSVTAVTSNAQRNLAVEDTAAAIFSFERGGIASATLSDAAVGPWAWELAAGDNIGRFPAHPVSSHVFAGTKAGFSLPDLTWWQHGPEKSWTSELSKTSRKSASTDAYDQQLKHFGEVIAGRCSPLVSLSEGLQSLAVIEAIKTSARIRGPVRLDG